MNRQIQYLDYTIKHLFDSPLTLWQFVANDYDGAIDSNDVRTGLGTTVEDCLQMIDEIILETQ